MDRKIDNVNLQNCISTDGRTATMTMTPTRRRRLLLNFYFPTNADRTSLHPRVSLTSASISSPSDYSLSKATLFTPSPSLYLTFLPCFVLQRFNLPNARRPSTGPYFRWGRRGRKRERARACVYVRERERERGGAEEHLVRWSIVIVDHCNVVFSATTTSAATLQLVEM